MTEEQRQKLRNWLTSMLVLALLTVLNMLAAWFWGTPQEWKAERVDTIFMAIPTVEATMLYIVGFMIAALWHLFDWVQLTAKDVTSSPAISRYSTFAISCTLLGILTVLLNSQHFLVSINFLATSPSGELPDTAFGYVRQSYWIYIPFRILWLFLPILCVAKAVISIRSRFNRPDDRA